jgi:multiple sugar transport system permease protein
MIMQRQKKHTPWPGDILKVICTLLWGAGALLMVTPFLFMLSSSFKMPMDIFARPIKWIPGYWYPNNYKYILSYDNVIAQMYLNSFKVTAICVSGSLFTSIMAAYSFSKINYKGRNFFFLLMISTMMIPAQLTYIPKFTLFSALHLTNTHWALIIPGLYAVVGSFLLKQFFDQIPQEMLDAARIDGAGELRICWQIIVPLAKPAIATFVITVFTNFWNDYDSPLIFLRNKKLFTVPLGMVSFSDEIGQLYHYTMAFTSLGLIPIFIVFLICQKYFIKGLTAGAVKM